MNRERRRQTWEACHAHAALRTGPESNLRGAGAVSDDGARDGRGNGAGAKPAHLAMCPFGPCLRQRFDDAGGLPDACDLRRWVGAARSRMHPVWMRTAASGRRKAAARPARGSAASAMRRRSRLRPRTHCDLRQPGRLPERTSFGSGLPQLRLHSKAVSAGDRSSRGLRC